ncbi:hypothetical protein EsVE80_02860 [Enterococcus saigonensis]|uniref:HTH lysR-type domain-containing protein n=1 Tax=Enterococcus saigonensis TaxID=1805431 RepID=A0A679I8V8_9ENTE|nr:LysR family transcriptional regulator [Enterococcus saigonensis]BCA84763.1 hypothetical protein EsVE80_02860 [Enterococcus saigonensis]
MLNLKILRSYKYAVDYSSFKAAAEKLMYSQSTISKHIAELEQAVGFPLFNEGKVQNGLTEIGELTYNYAQHALTFYGHFKEQVKATASCQTVVKIGGLERYLSEMVVTKVVSYQVDHPQLRFDLIHGTSDETLARLKAGELDMGIIADRMVPANFTSLAIKRESLVLIASSKTYEKILQDASSMKNLPVLIDRKASVIFEYVLKDTNEFAQVIHVEGDMMVLTGVERQICLGVISDGCFDGKDYHVLKTYNEAAPIRLIYPEKWEDKKKKRFAESLIRQLQQDFLTPPQ